MPRLGLRKLRETYTVQREGTFLLTSAAKALSNSQQQRIKRSVARANAIDLKRITRKTHHEMDN